MVSNDDIEIQREDFAQDLGSFNQKIVSIRTELNLAKTVDLTTNPGKYLNIWDFKSSENQQWRFVYDSTERSYQIVSVSTRQAIKSNADGSITMVNPTGSFEDYDYGAYWQLLKINNTNYYLIKNMASGLLLDLDNANTTNGTVVKTFKENGSNAQYWELIETGQTTGEFDGNIFTLHSELDWAKVLDADREGKKINIWDLNAGSNQQWRFQYNTTWLGYQIISVATGTCLNTNSSGDLMLTSPTNQFASSYWRVVKVEPYSCYTIENVETKKVLDVYNSNTENGNIITAYTKSGNTNQIWRLWEDQTPDFDGRTVFIRTADAPSQLIDLTLHDDGTGAPTQEVHIFGNKDGENQQWAMTRLPNGAYQFLSVYVYNPSGEIGTESQYWLESTRPTPTGANVMYSFIDGGASEWNPHLIPDKYDFDGRAVFALESASQPGKYLTYSGTENNSNLYYTTGMPGANDKNKLFSLIN